MTFETGLDSDLATKPVTVSSTSSIDTNASPSLAAGNENADNQTTSMQGLPQAASEVLSGCGQDVVADHGAYPETTINSNGASPETNSDGVPSSVSLVSPPNHLHMTPPSGSVASGVVVPAMPTTNTVPEFLYQLTKMLTDNNRDIIEWSNGKIEVHSPHKLEEQVLNRYFRHSKFASFQRQLNYFGFRKLAGKGKMAPCSYVNEGTTQDLGSLLLVKRKTGNEPKAKGTKKRDRPEERQSLAAGSTSKGSEAATVNPVLAGILYRSNNDQQGTQLSSTAVPLQRSSSATNALTVKSSSQPNSQPEAIARGAVGRGIRHGYTAQTSVGPQTVTSTPNPLGPKTPVEASLSALTSNYHSSLQSLSRLDAEENAKGQAAPERSSLRTIHDYIPGTLSRDDSLVDLAMIPILDESEPVPQAPQGSNALTFVDFPWLESNSMKTGAPES